MSKLEVIAESPLSVITDRVISDKNGGIMYGWLFECHGFWHNIGLIIPSFMFVVFLAFQAKKSFVKLSSGRSLVIIAYYGSLWVVSLFNLAWCLLQAWECTSTRETPWNILSLFTDAGMLFLEVSLVAFLLQGNHASGKEALTRTFVVSGLIVAFDILLKAIYLYGFSIPLFINDGESRNRVKWGLWVVHKLLLTAVYGIILFMYNSNWRETTCKTSILQVYHHNVLLKCGSIVSLSLVDWPWFFIRLMVIRSDYHMLPCLLSPSAICYISCRLL